MAEAPERFRRIAEGARKSGAGFDWTGLKSIYDFSGIPKSREFPVAKFAFVLCPLRVVFHSG